jgi:hypothetical protein
MASALYNPRLVLALLFLGGCFQAPTFTDGDGDGFAVEFGDCNDADPTISPGAPEDCNQIDDDCDLDVDEDFDNDGDGFISCDDDCDDNDPDVNPAAQDISDGIDNDCNGFIDDAAFDNDGDGISEDQGDCNDGDETVGPEAIEVAGDFVDNDCNNQIDEPLVPCDDVALNDGAAGDFAKAMGICDNRFLVSAQLSGSLAGARRIITAFGTNNVNDTLNRPSEGQKMVHLATGQANTNAHDQGTSFDGAFAGGDGVGQCISVAHPAPKGAPANNCGEADPQAVCDATELRLTLKVPQNAQSFSFNFQFLSSEYKFFRCSQFDDTFLALLTSQALGAEQNISFDNGGNVVSVNNGFFDICFDDNQNVNGGPPNDCSIDPVATLAGTGYNVNGGAQSDSAGATVQLTTTSPVVPGETITLRFIIFDEGDDILDSSVLIDNFLWQATPAAGPVTIP